MNCATVKTNDCSIKVQYFEKKKLLIRTPEPEKYKLSSLLYHIRNNTSYF